MRDDEILLDAGAHHGGVTLAFVARNQGRLPADHRHRAGSRQPRAPCWRDQRQRRASTIIDCALAEEEGEAPFHDGLGYASQLADTGRKRVATRPLDALGVSPTFVKLHLEGAELAALKGARRTLASSRPIIAATVYHNADGIWRTPLWLMQTLPDYRFLFPRIPGAAPAR